MIPVGLLAPDRLESFLASVVDADEPTVTAAAGYHAMKQALARSDLSRGDAVLLSGPHHPAFIGGFFALVEGGYVPVPHGPGRSERLGTIASALACAAIATIKATAVPRVTIETLKTDRVLPRQSYSPGEVVLLTSGTSGIASGCVHDLNSLLKNARKHHQSVSLGRSQRSLVVLPPYYSFALVAQVFAAFEYEGEAILASPPFTPDRFDTLLRKHNIDTTSLTPWLVSDLLSSGWTAPNQLDLLTVGGAELDHTATRQLRDRCASSRLAITYGLSEAGPRVSTLLTDQVDDDKLGSVGLPLDGVSVLQPCGSDTPAELVIQTDTAMLRRVGTKPQGAGDSGRIDTGDLFSRDRDGYLYFHARHRDVILHKGAKLNLRSVRQIVEESPLVLYSRTFPGDNGYSLELFTHPSGSERETSRDALRRLSVRERPSSLTVRSALGRPHK